MRVLIVSQYFWPEQFRINDLALELKARGHEVTVLSAMPNYPTGRAFEGYRHWWRKRRDNYEGIPVFRVPIFLRRQGKGWQLFFNYLSFVISGCLLAPWYFRKHDFDAIFVCQLSPVTVGIPAILMRRLKRVPMFFWVQDLWPESLTAAGAVHSSFAIDLVRRLVRWIYQHCDRILVQSEAFIEAAVRGGADQSRVVFFPNWAESFYRPVKEGDVRLPEAVVLPEGFRIMFAGNLGEAQSLETIVDAASRLQHEKEIQWVIIGDGRRYDWLREQVRERKLQHCITLLGRYPAEMMPHFFVHADALLVTLKNDEVFAQTVPSKVQSYMACGRPLLAALNGEGARVIAEAGCGLSVAAGDGKALADAAMRLYRLPDDQRQAMGECGRIYYNHHFERDMLICRLEQWMHDAAREGMCGY